MDVRVIIPTYNGEGQYYCLDWEDSGSGDDNIRVIIVDDNSPDGTGRIAEEMRESFPRIDVIHRSGKLGLGTAYIAGFKKALAEGADRIINGC